MMTLMIISGKVWHVNTEYKQSNLMKKIISELSISGLKMERKSQEMSKS